MPEAYRECQTFNVPTSCNAHRRLVMQTVNIRQLKANPGTALTAAVGE
jgi:hypothetical protein